MKDIKVQSLLKAHPGVLLVMDNIKQNMAKRVDSDKNEKRTGLATHFRGSRVREKYSLI